MPQARHGQEAWEGHAKHPLGIDQCSEMIQQLSGAGGISKVLRTQAWMTQGAVPISA